MNNKLFLICLLLGLAQATQATQAQTNSEFAPGTSVAAVFPAPIVFDERKLVQVLHIRPGGSGSQQVNLLVDCETGAQAESCKDIGLTHNPIRISIQDSGLARVKVAMAPAFREATAAGKTARIIVKRELADGSAVAIFSVPVRVK